MPKLLRRPSVLLGFALVAALVGLALWPTTIGVDVAAVSRGPLRVTLDEEGETRVRERFVISSPVAGRVLRIELEPGDHVRAGQALATVLPATPALLDARTVAELRATVESAEAALGSAQAEADRAATAVARARAQLDRIRDLAGSAVVSRDELEASESEAKGAEDAQRAATFAVGRARHERDAARARLLQASTPAAGAPARRIVVEAPLDAVVLKRVRESEGVVGPGEPLVELGDPGRLEVVADFLTTDAVRVRPGAPVVIDRWGGDATIAGRVRLVEPSAFTKVSALGVEEQRVNVVIDLVSPRERWASLGDGFRVDARVVVEARNDALIVPVAALFRVGARSAVFVVDADRARLRDVEPVSRSTTVTAIGRGLEPGERVIVFPGDRVSDGARVRIRDGSR